MDKSKQQQGKTINFEDVPAETDEEIKNKAFDILFRNLGSWETERFISLIKREQFDYTKWRENLLPFPSVEKLSKAAMDFQRDKIKEVRDKENVKKIDRSLEEVR